MVGEGVGPEADAVHAQVWNRAGGVGGGLEGARTDLDPTASAPPDVQRPSYSVTLLKGQSLDNSIFLIFKKDRP